MNPLWCLCFSTNCGQPWGFGFLWFWGFDLLEISKYRNGTQFHPRSSHWIPFLSSQILTKFCPNENRPSRPRTHLVTSPGNARKKIWWHWGYVHFQIWPKILVAATFWKFFGDKPWWFKHEIWWQALVTQTWLWFWGYRKFVAYTSGVMRFVMLFRPIFCC